MNDSDDEQYGGTEDADPTTIIDEDDADDESAESAAE